jgi:hypothetical protein
VSFANLIAFRCNDDAWRTGVPETLTGYQRKKCVTLEAELACYTEGCPIFGCRRAAALSIRRLPFNILSSFAGIPALQPRSAALMVYFSHLMQRAVERVLELLLRRRI